MNDPVPSLITRVFLATALAFGGGLGPASWAQSPRAQASASRALAAETRQVEFVHERVLPFRFSHPDSWDVWESPLGWSGRHWLLAGPRSAGLRAAKRPPGALAVTLRGYQPELALASDPLARAEALAKDTLRGRPNADRLSLGPAENLTLGALPGRLMPYTLRASDKEPTEEGLILVAVRGSSSLFAEIRWPAAEAEVHAKKSRALLASLAIDAEPKWVDYAWPTEGSDRSRVGLRHPENWPVTPVRTADSSLAFQLESPRGRELLLRTLPLKEGLSLDDDACRKVARSLLVDQMKLVTAIDVDDAPILGEPGTTGGLRILAEVRGILRDVRVFARRGALIVGILELPDYRAESDYGVALRILRSFRALGTQGVARPRLGETGHFLRPVSFATGDCDIFDDRGRPQRPRLARLRLAPDGSFRLFPTGLGLKEPRRGRYRIAAGTITLSFKGGTRSLDLDPSFDLLRPSEGSALYRVPDLP